ncbi:maltoporin [Photobacterium sanctipauli]|uniref:Maltoporin n=1 Tax=Photobacterium sanctipauli TaxID=1342794 RepID=A0A2T3NW79_9GAMM|nr:carbohydrate porin [Photobacterium sanctipauli]PSW20516.1 maltoporin [Photobacterium sanctipauli]
MKHKLVPVAAALLTALTSYNVAAESATDIITDGWEIHGYGSMNLRYDENFATFDGDMGKEDYRYANTATSESTNQVEFVIKKHTEFQNGVYSDFVIRSEYGNGNTHAYSSEGSQKTDTDAMFEIKEAYVALGNLPYLPANSEIWAGQRFLNRSAGILTGEFWKQSSGVGAGFETNLESGHKTGVAIVSVDPDAGKVDKLDERQTATSLDFYYYGVQALGGSFDFDLKLMRASRTNPEVGSDDADRGIGGSITYNRDFYGFDGWSQTAVGYGTGLATNRGVNFGSWSGGGAFSEDSKSLFITSYGVANIGENWQLGTEITYWAPENINWVTGADGAREDEVERLIFAARPTYKVNDNLRLEFTGSYAIEDTGEVATSWGRSEQKNSFYSLEAATVFTVNADYFGRPQIKPYVTWFGAENEDAAINGEKSQFVFGIHSEIWF